MRDISEVGNKFTSLDDAIDEDSYFFINHLQMRWESQVGK